MSAFSSAEKSLKVASLGSGSRGNATLVSDGETTLLIDCGFSVKEVNARLQRFNMAADALDAVLVTHEHGDHIAGVGALARRFSLPVYATRGTSLSQKLGVTPELRLIEGFKSFRIGAIEVQPIPVPHDAREPCQFVFQKGVKSLGVLTDLGSITDDIIGALSSCHGLLLEFNHDAMMLEEGRYPRSLKARVGGNLGHLSNPQAIDLLRKMNTESLEWLVASHISEQNNCTNLVKQLLEQESSIAHCEKVLACQNQGFEWLEL